MRLQHGDKIKLAPASLLWVSYYEYDAEAHHTKPDGHMHVGELYLDGVRINIIQAYNGQRKMNRTWLRSQMAKWLDTVCPTWKVVYRKSGTKHKV